ncbi:hypothetical protein ACJIZ3_007286 [Penstemon smallii]|uniref:SWIM-type domain-containing protein n=1 Tax=Penstemon smallii TaxID=265156 RepID=A0ABD3SAD5_9LAMI
MSNWGETISLDLNEVDVVHKSSVILENVDIHETRKQPLDSFASQLEENLLRGEFNDINDCFEAYNEYGVAMGFSVRKGKQYYYPGTKDLRKKWFYCSCEGVKDEKCNGQVAYNRFDARTGCQANISFEKDKYGVWKVANFIKEHNHDLALPHERHFLRSARRISKSTGDLLETFVDSGIKPVDGISYLIKESGGPQNVSFIPKDAYNYLHSLRRTKMEMGDASALLSYFRNKKDEDPMFDWDMELDEEGRLANLFWRDGKSRMDYDCFGDVVSFDTTYRTNKYGLKCAVFVGVNNHWKNVIFGCAFLSWETTESFEWLFSTFLRLMGGKQPSTIFTDQAQAIINAVDRKLPETRHRLCQWHLSENASKHIGTLNGNPHFWAILHKCYSKCDTEVEFEKVWMEIKDLAAQSNTWLNKLYELRHRWSTAFNNDVFNAGIKATSRSESTNRVLNTISNYTTSLYDFIVAFEVKILGKWRENERHDDFRCTHFRVPMANKSNPLLIHASELYTHTIYKLFESELTSSGLSYNSVEIPVGKSQFKFEVYKKIKPEKVKTVFIDTDTYEVRCPCRKFESMGILCRHSLKALDMKNASKIPERYIVKRWLKTVRDSIDIDKFESHNLAKEEDEPAIVYGNRAMRFTYGMISKSRSHKEGKAIVWKHLIKANQELNEFLQHKVLNDNFEKNSTNEKGNDGENRHPNVNIVLDPRRVRPKGGKNRRIKSHIEKRRQQNKKKSNSSLGKKNGKKVAPSLEATQEVLSPLTERTMSQFNNGSRHVTSSPPIQERILTDWYSIITTRPPKHLHLRGGLHRPNSIPKKNQNQNSSYQHFFLLNSNITHTAQCK